MNFAQRLRSRELLIGAMLTIPAPEVAEMIAKCGFDWLFLDGEHSALATLDWQRMMQAVGGRCAAVLRVPIASELAIKKALDIGADGIIAPQVNSADQARRVVDWCKYPPRGARGIGLARAQGYGLDFSAYIENANDNIAVIVQVEHSEAVGNIESIARVDGIDAIFIGPYDLSASLGKTGRLDDPEVVEAISTVSRVCRRAGKALGYFGVSSSAVRPYIDQGYSLICAGVDAGFITGGAGSVVADLKQT